MSAPSFRVGAATHVGMVRTMNEDAFVAQGRVFAVADGMGGHLAGEVASAMAIEALAALDGHVTADAVVTAVLDANHDILQMSRSDASRRGMGTTLTALALVHPDGETGPAELAVVNLGDSRTYRFRNGRLEQVTVDHSYVQELVSGGHLSPEEARHHPQRNIVTRALGIEPDVGVDVWNLPIVNGDRYLLCSDGLVDEVTDHAIATVLSEVDDPQAAAAQLVDLANRSGGRDNVTVVVVDVAAVPGAGAMAVPGGAADERPADPVTAPLPLVPPSATPPSAGFDVDSTNDRIDVESSDGRFGIDSTQDRIDIESPRSGEDPTGVLGRVVLPGGPDPVLNPTDSEPALAATARPAAAEPVVAPAKRSRTNLAVVGALGGAAVLAGIVLVAVRNAGDDEPAPTTVVTTLAPATTAGTPATTLSGVTSPSAPAPSTATTSS